MAVMANTNLVTYKFVIALWIAEAASVFDSYRGYGLDGEHEPGDVQVGDGPPNHRGCEGI